MLKSFGLDSLRVENGAVILRGEGRAAGTRIEALTLEASLPAFDDPLSLDLKAKFDGKPVQVTGSIATFGPFLDGTAAPVLLDVDAPRHTMELDLPSGLSRPLAVPAVNPARCFAVTLYGPHASGTDLDHNERAMLARLAHDAVAMHAELESKELRQKVVSLARELHAARASAGADSK
jgi:hypothetical protein